MDRNELIEKVIRAMQKAPKPECDRVTAGYIADIIAELQEKPDEWPQKHDRYWRLTSDGYSSDIWSKDEYDENRVMRGIFRTEAEADLADRQRIARTAIHRWIAENAEKVDWKNLHIKTFPVLCDGKWEQYCWTEIYIPDWFYVYEKDYDRMMSDNAQHFEVLKEGM